MYNCWTLSANILTFSLAKYIFVDQYASHYGIADRLVKQFWFSLANIVSLNPSHAKIDLMIRWATKNRFADPHSDSTGVHLVNIDSLIPLVGRGRIPDTLAGTFWGSVWQNRLVESCTLQDRSYVLMSNEDSLNSQLININPLISRQPNPEVSNGIAEPLPS